jgi:F-type H+-transporting ATPase subunit b
LYLRAASFPQHAAPLQQLTTHPLAAHSCPANCPAVAHLSLPFQIPAVANVIMAMPAAAEAGKLFDFNLTLPIMAGEILLLMVFLDKFWFGPVGKVRPAAKSIW